MEVKPKLEKDIIARNNENNNDICHDVFKSIATLTSHMRHTGDTPHKCTQCPLSFATSNSLKVHVQIMHNDVKREICQKCFSYRRGYRSTLQVNERLRTSDPHQCQSCDRRSKQPSLGKRLVEYNGEENLKKLPRENDALPQEIQVKSIINESDTLTSFQKNISSTVENTRITSSGNNDSEEKVDTQCYTGAEAVLDPMESVFIKRETNQSNPIRGSDTETERYDYFEIKELDDVENIKVESEQSQINDHYVDCELATNEAKENEQTQQEVKPLNAIIQMETKDTSAAAKEKLEKYLSIENERKIRRKLKCQSKLCVKSTSDITKNKVEANYVDCDLTMNEPKGNEQAQQELKLSNARIKMETKVPSAKEKLQKSEKERKVPTKLLSQCELCAKRTSDLTKHMVQAHSDIERPFQCFVCDKTYKEFNRLRYHIRRHDNVGTFICQFCAKVCFLSSDLAKHIYQRHENIRPFKCNECDKFFKTRSALLIHGRSHSGYKPFTCEVCSKSFTTKGALKSHSRHHSGDKPYICLYCGKSFAISSMRRQHERVHSGVKPYQCHLCDRRTTQASNLKSHYRHHHKVIVKHVTMFQENPNAIPTMQPVPVSDAKPVTKRKLQKKKM